VTTVETGTAERAAPEAVKTRGKKVWIGLGIVIGAILLLNLAARGLDEAVGGNEPKGVSGSSYATNAEGLAAYATLLARYDHDVTYQRGAIVDHPPPTDTTLYVLDPQVLTEEDAGVLLAYATNGGRLVIGGPSPFYLGNLRDEPPTWSSRGLRLWNSRMPGIDQPVRVETAGEGAWTSNGASDPVIAARGLSLLTVEQVGQGEIWFLADASMLTNEYLARADNATVGIELAGDRPVIFAEGVHGYGADTGYSAIPTQWKWALVLLGVAALAYIWSRARRFGPPDIDARELPPARAQYVEALSTTLERTHQRAAALAPAQAYARDRIAARAGLGPDANEKSLVAAARSLGCTEHEIAALATPVSDDAHALALGRAVARVTSADRRTSE
jgi:hypothetical protein